MTAPALEILGPIRTAIVAVTPITSKLGVFLTNPSVHTRRPAPEGAEYPMVMVGPIITRTENDAINDYRPRVVVDVNVYGRNPEHQAVVEEVAEAIYGLFHRQLRSLSVAGYTVSQLRCSGPSPAPADDLARVGRRVTLTIDLYGK